MQFILDQQFIKFLTKVTKQTTVDILIIQLDLIFRYEDL
jgi:hypothetical protein